MKMILVPLVLTASVLLAAAQENSDSYSAEASSLGKLGWNANPDHWDRILREKPSESEIRIGRSDFVVTSPLIGGFRRERVASDASLGRKILGLPVIRLFVPQVMPKPPGGTGRYFAWRNSEDPWPVRAGFAAPPSSTGAYR